MNEEDIDKLELEQRRSRDAARFLEEPLYVEARAAIRKDLLNAWEASPARDTEGRERIWTSIKLLDKIHAHFETHVTTGKLASKQLTDLGDRKKFFGVI